MNEIDRARSAINRRVGICLLSHPAMAYGEVAVKLGVSRWRVLMVASRLGISRKTGPKPKQALSTMLPKTQRRQ